MEDDEEDIGEDTGKRSMRGSPSLCSSKCENSCWSLTAERVHFDETAGDMTWVKAQAFHSECCRILGFNLAASVSRAKILRLAMSHSGKNYQSTLSGPDLGRKKGHHNLCESSYMTQHSLSEPSRASTPPKMASELDKAAILSSPR